MAEQTSRPCQKFAGGEHERVDSSLETKLGSTKTWKVRGTQLCWGLLTITLPGSDWTALSISAMVNSTLADKILKDVIGLGPDPRAKARRTAALVLLLMWFLIVRAEPKEPSKLSDRVKLFS